MFTGRIPITLLGFIATMRDALNTTGATDAPGMNFIAYYLVDEARDIPEELLTSVSDGPEEELFKEGAT